MFYFFLSLSLTPSLPSQQNDSIEIVRLDAWGCCWPFFEKSINLNLMIPNLECGINTAYPPPSMLLPDKTKQAFERIPSPCCFNHLSHMIFAPSVGRTFFLRRSHSSPCPRSMFSRVSWWSPSHDGALWIPLVSNQDAEFVIMLLHFDARNYLYLY